MGPVDSGMAPDSGVGPDEDQDQWADEIDNCPAIANPEQRDRDSDGMGDACDVCPATPNSGLGGQPDACELLTETEPNNTIEQGQMVAVREMGKIFEIRGSVEAPTPDGNQAFDRFKIMVGAGTLFKVRAARASKDSLLEPLITVSGGGYTTERRAHGLFVAQRYIYCAEAGIYTVSIADRRGVLDEAPHGDLAFEYGLSVEAVPVQALSRQAPVSGEPFIIDGEGQVALLDITLGASEFTLIAAETDLDVVGIGVDTILVLERADGSVVENDALADGYSDARIIAQIDTEETVRIIIDHAQIYGPGEHEVSLTVAQPDTTRELEPNDQASLASKLIFPGQTGGQVTAAVDPDVGPPDTDWYYLDGRAGQVLALSGLIGPSSIINPFMALVQVREADGEQDIDVLYFNTDSSGKAPRIEAILPDDGRYYVLVGEEQNLGDPPFAGGPLYEYGIFAEATGIQPDPQIVTSSSSIDGLLDPGGRLKRHLVVADEPTLVLVDVGQSGDDVEPFIRMFGPQAKGLIGQGLGAAMAYLPGPQTYVLTVNNANNGLGGPNATYNAEVTYYPLVAKTEAEPNDAAGQATPLDGAQDVVTGELSGETDIDRFSITVPAGTLDAVLSVNGRDRQVQVMTPGGGVIGAGLGGAVGVALPAPGTFDIEVSGPAGPYTLIFRTY